MAGCTTEIVIQLQLKQFHILQHYKRQQLESAREHYMLQLAGLSESYPLEKYLQELMRQDLKTDMQLPTIPTDAILGMHLQKYLQDQTWNPSLFVQL